MAIGSLLEGGGDHDFLFSRRCFSVLSDDTEYGGTLCWWEGSLEYSSAGIFS